MVRSGAVADWRCHRALVAATTRAAITLWPTPARPPALCAGSRPHLAFCRAGQGWQWTGPVIVYACRTSAWSAGRLTGISRPCRCCAWSGRIRIPWPCSARGPAAATSSVPGRGWCAAARAGRWTTSSTRRSPRRRRWTGVPARTRRSAAAGSATWDTAPRARRCRRPARGGCPRGGSAGTTTCCAGTGRRGSGSSRRCAPMARPWSSGSRICRGGPRNRPPTPATSSAATSGWSRPPPSTARRSARRSSTSGRETSSRPTSACARRRASAATRSTRSARRRPPWRPRTPRSSPCLAARSRAFLPSCSCAAPTRPSSPSPSRARRPATRPTATRPKRSGPPWSARRRTARRT